MASATFVTIAGIDLKVFIDNASEDETELLGDFRRGDDGGVQTSQRTPKRAFACVAKFFPTSDYDTFLAAVSVLNQNGVPTPVTVTSPSDGLTRGATLTAYVRCGRAQYRSTGTGTVKTNSLSVSVTIREA